MRRLSLPVLLGLTIGIVCANPIGHNEKLAERAALVPRCNTDYRFFQFEKRDDCKIPHIKDEPIPPPDCPPQPENRDGLLFRNVHSVDQHDFGWYTDLNHDIALVAPPPNITTQGKGAEVRSNGPLTIMPDPSSKVVSFDLHSLRAVCRYYESAKEFIDGGNPANCTINIHCDVGKPRRALATNFFVYEWWRYPQIHWSISDVDLWEFGAQFSELSKCELSVRHVDVGDDYRNDGTHYAIMIDDLAVTVTTC